MHRHDAFSTREVPPTAHSDSNISYNYMPRSGRQRGHTLQAETRERARQTTTTATRTVLLTAVTRFCRNIVIIAAAAVGIL